jgi:hydrogenase maturation protein HypF
MAGMAGIRDEAGCGYVMGIVALNPSYASITTSRIRVRGIVQGVGFRPFVYRLAHELNLCGWVRNDAEGVEIMAQGNRLAELLRRLVADAPMLARVDELSATPVESEALDGFVILKSVGGHAHTGIAPDAAICPDCMAEIFDPGNRRYRYPFSNCTHCGPRYTITRHLPYDRPNTSMADFVLCQECSSEYHDPLDRRFHAQPNACPVCGPRLTLHDAKGQAVASNDPIAAALAQLQAGQILAIKGLGGFHLMSDARNCDATARLRKLKQRDEKPFAVMLAGYASVAQFARSSESERELLESGERPIVLLLKLAATDAMLPGIAPGMHELGVMLPYTPLHYLLFFEAAGRPQSGIESPQSLALLCTSANPGGEPLVTDNFEALSRLQGIADGFLLHDRDIVVRCDDSVVRTLNVKPGRDLQFIRRARGYTPRAIKLAKTGRSVLACGGWYKNTLCLTRGNEAFLSQHIGDLNNASTCRSLEETAQHLMQVLEIEPEMVVHDLHPDFYSSHYAATFASTRGIPLLGIQHHHAHIAAVLAEHGLAEPVLGLALDGVGLGSNGNAWGGELLRVEQASFERLGHFHELALPGGDRAAREPWRMAASALHALGRGMEIEHKNATAP